MSLQTYSEFEIPAPVGNAGASASSLSLGTSEKYGYVFQVPKTGNINKVHFTIFGITTNQTLKLSLQTVDTSTGKPTGTLYGGSATQTLTPTKNVTNTVPFSTPAAATAGDFVAFVIEWDSTSGSLTLAYYLRNPSMPCYYKFTSGAWGSVNAGLPNMQCEYDDGTTPHHGNLPVFTNSSASFHSGSATDERGIKFQIPFPARASGVWIVFSYSSGSANFDLVLYDASSNVLTSISLNASIIHNSGELTRFFWPTKINISANTVYRLSIKPTQSSQTITMPYWSFTDSARRAMFPGASTVYETHRVDLGSWTDDQTILPVMGLILDQAADDNNVGYTNLTGI